MKNNFLIGLALFAIYTFTSCNELVEKDLKSDWVYALSPQDFAVVNSQSPVLAWEKVKGAISYNLKLYRTTKDYQTVTELLADTNVTGTQYTHSLKSGYYRWNIYAQNGSSESGLSVFRFQVDSASDITNQRVILISPLNNVITDTLEQTLVWSSLASAAHYNIQVYEFNSGKIGDYYKGGIVNKNITSFVCEFPSTKKTYKWMVQAINGSLSSQIGEHIITIDTTKLAIPGVISPKNDTLSIHTKPIIFKWNAVTTATTYFIEVKNDTSASTTDTTYTIDKTVLSQTYYNAKLSIKYYWRVTALRGTTKGLSSKWWSFRLN